jgi:phosphoserine phosphatase
METLVLSEFVDVEAAARRSFGQNRSALIVNARRGDAAWFARAMREAEAGLFDFDGTLHAGSQWEDVRALLGTDDARADRAEADLYFRRADGEPSSERITRFHFNSVRRMARSGIRRGALELRAAASPPRSGAVALVGSFGSGVSGGSHGRSAVVSFGLYDYIAAWCAANGLGGVLVAATRLLFDEHATVRGADPLTFVGTHTKGHAAHAIAESFDVPMDRVLVLGDSPTDMHMMSEGNIAVLVLPHVDADPERIAFRLRGLAEMWPRVAAVLVSDSLDPLVALRRATP